MNIRLIMGAGLLLSAATVANAQDMNGPPPPDTAMPTTPTDPNAAVPPAPVPDEPNMVPATPGVAENPAAPEGSATNPAVVGGNMTPPPPMEKYPVCSKTITDHCMQARDLRWNKMKKKPR